MSAGVLNYDIKISGLEDLAYKLHLLPVKIRDRARKALVTTSSIVVRCAKQLAPKDTTNLAENIRAQWSPTNPLVRQVIADVGGKDLRYIAAPVEFGRKKYNRKDAQPFLRPCLKKASVFQFSSLVDAVQQAIDELSSGGSSRVSNAGSIGAHVNAITAARVPKSPSIGGGGVSNHDKSHTLGYASAPKQKFKKKAPRK